jgi:hypothetical protein
VLGLLVGLASLAAATGCTAVDDLTEPSCTYNVAPGSANFGASGGPGQLNVSASGVCAWTVADPPAWITINGSRSGNGDGTVSFSVAPNPDQTSRTATFAVATRTVTINQSAAPCTITVEPTTTSFGAAGGRGAVNIGGPPGCAWAATTDIGWIRLRDPRQGTGNGRVEFDVDPNPGSDGRAGTIQIGGQGVVVSQDGMSSAPPGPPASSCSVSLSPPSASVGAGGGTASFTVSASDGCAWTASADQGWIRVTSGGSGSGPGTIRVAVDPNSSSSARAGSVSAGGQSVAVLQGGAGGQTCGYAVSPTSAAAAATGGAGTIQVGAPAGCNWTAVSSQPWLTITDGNAGAGNGTVQYAVAPNTTTSARTAVVTINGITTTITQAAATTAAPPPALNCSVAIAPSSAGAPASGVTGATVQVTAPAGCAWTATTGDPWIAITAGATGTGNGTVQYTVAPYTGLTPRSGTVTIGGQTFTVTQAAVLPPPTCTYALSPTSFQFSPGRQQGTIQVTAGAGCSWTATSSATWLTFTSGTSGTGNGSVAIEAAPNNSGAARSATVTIGGQTVTVTQRGN